jgi:hypothetical protein
LTPALPDTLPRAAYVTTVTRQSRTVLAAARLAAILTPYVSQSNDEYLLDSRLLPALTAAVATGTAPPPPPPPGDSAEPSPAASTASLPASGAASPREAAACALALLGLADATPSLYRCERLSARARV